MQVNDAINCVLNYTKTFLNNNNYKDKYNELDYNRCLNMYSYEDLVSPYDVPKYNSSLMDGYAINVNEFNNKQNEELELIINDKIYPDSLINNNNNILTSILPENKINSVYVTTGSTVPEYYNCVIPVEYTINKNKDNKIYILKSNLPNIKYNLYIRLAGTDIKKNAILINKGIKISEFYLSSILSSSFQNYKYQKIKVYRPLNICLLSTGDELIDEHSICNNLHENDNKSLFNRVYDINKLNLKNLLNKKYSNALNIIDYGVIKDKKQEVVSLIVDKIMNDNDIDIIITTGAVSMGEKDFIKKIIFDEKCDKKNIGFTNVNIKPGYPSKFMLHNNNKLLFCLPGNPVSAMVGYFLYVETCLNFILNSYRSNSNIFDQNQLYNNYYDNRVLYNVNLLDSITLSSKRPEYIRGIVYFVKDTNELYCIKTEAVSRLSSTISSLIGCNCLIITPSVDKDQILSKVKVNILLIDDINIIDLNSLNNLKNSIIKDVSNNKKNETCFCLKSLDNKLNLNNQIAINVGLLVISDKLLDNKYESNLAFGNFSTYFNKINKDDVLYNHSLIDIIRNNKDAIKLKLLDTIKNKSNNKIDIIITSGGTGISDMDFTSQATKEVIDLETTGISQLIIQESIKISKLCAISRLTSGIKDKVFIVNFPGNPSAIIEILNIIEPLFKHIYNQINKITDFH